MLDIFFNVGDHTMVKMLEKEKINAAKRSRNGSKSKSKIGPFSCFYLL